MFDLHWIKEEGSISASWITDGHIKQWFWKAVNFWNKNRRLRVGFIAITEVQNLCGKRTLLSEAETQI